MVLACGQRVDILYLTSKSSDVTGNTKLWQNMLGQVNVRMGKQKGVSFAIPLESKFVSLRKVSKTMVWSKSVRDKYKCLVI